MLDTRSTLLAPCAAAIGLGLAGIVLIAIVLYNFD